MSTFVEGTIFMLISLLFTIFFIGLIIVTIS